MDSHTIEYTVEGRNELFLLSYSVSGSVITYRWPDGHTCAIEIPDDWYVNEDNNYNPGIVPSDMTPLPDGTATPGVSVAYSRGDHVHQKLTYTKSDVGLGNVANVLQYSANNPPPSDTSKANETELADVESGTTASRAYSTGEYFCWGGLLYRVTTPINNGATLIVNTNCVQTTVMAEILRLTS